MGGGRPEAVHRRREMGVGRPEAVDRRLEVGGRRGFSAVITIKI